MFTRIVECTVKPEKKEEFNQKLRNEVLEILRKQPGFVDLIGLVSETSPERVLGISLWNTREDADRYSREHYTRVLELLKPYLKTATPKVETFHVDTWSTQRISAGRAA
jgi:quinol monooxygenase YgiN